MILYHWTEKKNIKQILKEGLIKKSYFIYLTKYPERWKGMEWAEILLKVNVPEEIKLTCFEEMKDGTEVLCWDNIPVKNIEVIRDGNK